jgi:hypothetical protein
MARSGFQTILIPIVVLIGVMGVAVLSEFKNQEGSVLDQDTAVIIVDDGDPDFHIRGARWSVMNEAGYGADYRFHQPTRYDISTEWFFVDVPAGTYDVIATWVPYSFLDYDVPYQIFLSGGKIGGARVDQRFGPIDITFQGTSWNVLDRVTIGTGEQIRVLVDEPGRTRMTADAVGLVRLAD